MPTIGTRRMATYGMRGPTREEVEASVEASERAPRFLCRGIHFHRDHASANAQSERWTVDALVHRAREIDAEVAGKVAVDG